MPDQHFFTFLIHTTRSLQFPSFQILRPIEILRKAIGHQSAPSLSHLGIHIIDWSTFGIVVLMSHMQSDFRDFRMLILTISTLELFQGSMTPGVIAQVDLTISQDSIPTEVANDERLGVAFVRLHAQTTLTQWSFAQPTHSGEAATKRWAISQDR